MLSYKFPFIIANPAQKSAAGFTTHPSRYQQLREPGHMTMDTGHEFDGEALQYHINSLRILLVGK